MTAKPVLIRSSAKILVPSSACSCIDCESASCFKKRYNSSTQCSCNKCKNSKTCLFYSNLVLKDSLSAVNDNENDKSDKKIDCNSNRMDKIKSKSLSLGLNRNMSTVDKDSKNKHTEEKSCCEFDTTNKTNCIQKHSEYYSYIMSNPKVGDKAEYVKETVTLVQNMTVPSNTAVGSTSAKLSAQVMNVPYKEFKNSISFNKPKRSITKLTKYDILQRIKDAYDACSCKVCECIANISPTNTEICNCKPCACDDCKKFKIIPSNTKYTINDMTSFDKLETCDELQSRCKCQPCECIECDQDKAACDCEPCQCLECKSISNKQTIKTVIVAPVEDDHRRFCQCNPCACFECAHVFGHIDTTNTHEISTGMSRHPNCRCELCLNEACEREGVDACRCEQHKKVMRKPVQRSTHDYDIRRATVTRDFIDTNTTQKAKKPVDNTIAMLAALPRSCPKTKGDCACDVCQCIECECKDKIANSLKSPQDHNLMQNKLPYKSNTCKCAPCECEICTNGEIAQTKRNCKCDVCDCILCANLTKLSFSNENAIKPFKTLFSKNATMCSCEPCECIECQSKYGNNNINNINPWLSSNEDMCLGKNSEIVHPIKKGKLLRFSVSKTDDVDRNNDSFKDCSGTFYDTKSVSPQSQVSFKNYSEDLMCHAFSRYHNSYQYFPVLNSMTNPIVLQSPRNSNEKYIDAVSCRKSKSTTNLEFKKRVNVPLSCTYTEADCQASGSYISAVSSYATMSRMSYANESGSASPFSIEKYNKSWESSCNSSGHDHSDYLIQFPRNTVETCINDVLKLNLDRKLNLNQLNVQLKASTRKVSLHHHPPSPPSQHGIQCRERQVIESNNPIPPEQIYYPKICNKQNVENSCEYEQYFCDKCSYTKLNFSKCKCECKACSCCGLCLREDLSFYIRKNECTQTNKQIIFDHDGADERTGVKVNSITDSVNKKIRQLESQLLHSKELEVYKDEVVQNILLKAFNKSLSNRNIINGFVNENNFPFRYGNCYTKHTIDFFNLNIYESVHRTIREARAFSLELMQLLEKYEKANREFESVSQKLMESHKATIDGYNYSNGDLIVKNEPPEREDTINNSKVNLFVEISFKPRGDKYEHDSKIKNKEAVCKESLIKHILNSKTERVIHPEKHADSIKTLNSNENETAPELGTTSTFVSPSKDLQKSYERSEEIITNKIYFDDTKEREIIALQKIILDIIEDLLKNIVADPSENRKYFKEFKKHIKRPAELTAMRNFTGNKIELSENSNISSQKMEDKKQNNCLSMTVKQLKEMNNLIEYEQRINDEYNKSIIALLSPPSGGNDPTIGGKTIQMAEEIKILSHKDRPMEAEITNKNICKNVMPFLKKENEVTTNKFLEFPPREEPVKSISQEARRIEANKSVTVPYKNKALANLLTEVQNMNDMPIFRCQGIDNDNKSDEQSMSNMAFDTSSLSFSQTQLKKKTDSFNTTCPGITDLKMGLQQDKASLYLPTFNNIKDRQGMKSTLTHSNIEGLSSSFASRTSDDMKVQFQAVRRVSDHTILVKWNAPRAVSEVKGYELLVDGRPVKKILSPTRCMAVVTCLPHSDKVLLTVRTITSKTGQSGLPSTTIVYRHRVK